MTSTDILLALTMGDPAGIGPEISLKAWSEFKAQKQLSFIFIGCPEVIQHRADQMDMKVPLHICAEVEEAKDIFQTAFPVLAVPCSRSVKPGQSAPDHANAVTRSIELAVDLVRSGKVDAVVTNPITKSSLKKADFPYPGHTEFLAKLSDNAFPVMMLEGGGLKTIPLTRHIPLKDVAGALKKNEIIQTARTANSSLKKFFDISSPRIAISGLNPHAGEQGVLGLEETKIIKPAIEALKEMGVVATGPLPADTMFHETARAQYDVAICMYHDQALIPVKMIGFETGVNITLGLDFIRTSPDHGTALDIAAQYKASPDSLISALKTAAKMSANLKNGTA